MKDLSRMFVMLVLVMAFMAITTYLGIVLSNWTMALLWAVIAVIIIMLVIHNFDRWFGQRTKP